MSTTRNRRADVRASAFRAMGTDAEVIVVGGPDGLLDQAIAEIARLERRWSRFLPDSDVSVINRNPGTVVAVDPSTALLVQRAIAAWRITGGAFDPTVLGAMLRAGYDCPFDPACRERVATASGRIIGASDVAVDLNDATVRIPASTGFDPGGIGKGLAADLVVTMLLELGADGACANLGGDLRVEGRGPVDSSWTIAIDHAERSAPVALLTLAGGAITTSTTLKRRWTVDGQRRHHLIDPVTGRPADTDVELMTVVAGQAWMAEALATAGLLRGAERMFDLLQPDEAALAVLSDGTVHTAPSLQPFLVHTTTAERAAS